MKFSLVVLLGLCAFASGFDIFEEVPDVDFVTYEPIMVPRSTDLAVAGAANDFMKKATEKFNALVQKFKDLSKDLRDKAGKFIAEKQSQVASKMSQLYQEISNLAKKGAKYAQCGTKHEVELKDISNSVQLGIKECTVTIVEALKTLAKEVAIAGVVLADNFMRLKDIVLECYNKSNLGAAKCVWDNLTELKNIVGALITGTQQAIEAFKEHGTELIESAKACNDNHIQTTLIKFQNVKTLLISCANN